jgi:O-acetyl-ADP-ribose deacetylase (regulator of RNase III)
VKIVYKTGNLLDVKAGNIVSGCNAQGMMGSGVALAIRNMYPECYEDYRAIHDDEGLELGEAYPYCPTIDLVIWNAITQEFCGNDGQRYVSYDAIQICFEGINRAILECEINIKKEIHIPFLGAGLARGQWPIIAAIIEDTCTVPVTVWSIDGKMPDGSLVG